MNFIILTRSGNGSPLILANSVKNQLEECGHHVVISTQINILNRLVSFKNNTLSFHFWLWEKLINYIEDRRLICKLKKSDAVVISECIPNGFWNRLYNVERLKQITRKPVFFYEVYYLGNAPTQIIELKKNNNTLLERYDAHLFVSPITETRIPLPSNAFCIGLRAKDWDLHLNRKKELVALVDFVQPGYELFRKLQINMLKKARIKYISLEKKYSIDEIRDIYREVSIFFIQSPEAFGLPILECLCTGAQVFTPHSGWPMSWRLDESAAVHSSGILPSCFTVYGDKADLLQKLLNYKTDFHPINTPLKVFSEFRQHYPNFFEGNVREMERCIELIKSCNN